MRALVLSNMRPDRAHPERGSFVRDQLAALRRLQGIDVELLEFDPGARALARAALALRSRRGERYDVVHAHFGLTAWPALAARARVHAVTLHGTDLEHPRTRAITAAALPRMQLVAAVSEPLLARIPGARARRRALVLPVGADLARFRPVERAQARAELGLDANGRYVLFPADPARPAKRHDLAAALAAAAGAKLLALGGVAPERVPLWVNAADAVVVPSEREGFGLAVIEALACDVPVLATPVGVHAQALAGIAGTLCAPFELDAWARALAPHLGAAASRIEGRARAERYSSDAMAERVAGAWRRALAGTGGADG